MVCFNSENITPKVKLAGKVIFLSEELSSSLNTFCPKILVPVMFQLKNYQGWLYVLQHLKDRNRC